MLGWTGSRGQGLEGAGDRWDDGEEAHGGWKAWPRAAVPTASSVVVDLRPREGCGLRGRMGQVADFFVSYTSADRAWAEWVAWQLEQAGYSVIIQAWDFEPGENFVVRMRDALEQADRTLALVSAAYLASPYCTDEWTGAFLHDHDGRNRLLQIRIEGSELPRLMRAQIYVDLVGLPRKQARARLLAEVKRGRRKPSAEPSFPPSAAMESGPRFPGHGLEITNLPARNPDFSGRGAFLQELHETLTSGGQAAVVQAATVHGLGGVGKTQLALEYAHRYATDYDVIWWIPAEQPVAIPGLLAGLGQRLGVPEQTDQAELLASIWDVLRERDRWLLIYDNADRPQNLDLYRPPDGGGHVLLTSRSPRWGRTTATVRLDVLDREEAVTFLRRRTASTDTATLAAVAEALGDLPLALEQAAAYMDETHTTSGSYLALYREHSAELLALGEPLTTDQTVATTWQVALDRVHATPGAQDLLSLCAFLAPDHIPRALLLEHAEVLPEPFRQTIKRPLAVNQAVSELGRYSLVAVAFDTLTVHRLVQAVVRASLSAEDQRQWAGAAMRLINAGFPRGSDDPATWPACALLLPHGLSVVDHAEKLDVAAEARAQLLPKAANYVFDRGQYQQALTLREQALAGFRRVFGEDHPDILSAMNNLAEARASVGDLHGAQDLHEQALASFRRVLGDDHLDTLRSTNNLAEARRALGDVHGAHDLHQQTLAGRRRVLGEDHPDTLGSMNNLAGIRCDLGNLKGARDLYEQALAGFRRVLGDDNPRTLVLMDNLAGTLARLGDLDGARGLHDQTLASRRRVLGEDHPDTLMSMNNLAMTRRDLDDLHHARELFEQTLASHRRVLGEDHPDTLMSMNNLAFTRWDLGDLHGARELFEQTLAGCRRVLGDDHPDTQVSMHGLAETRRQLGDLQGARELHEQTLAARCRVLGDNDPSTLQSMHGLADTHQELGDLHSALKLHQQILGTRRRILGDEHPDTLWSMHCLAETRRELGDLQGAGELHEQVLAARQRVLGEDHPDTLTSRNNLAAVRRERSKH
jgi:tetratricopeptide (TPR) repeat protein